MDKDPIVNAIEVLSAAQLAGDRALLNLVEALIEKVHINEQRLFEVECQLQEGPPQDRRKLADYEPVRQESAQLSFNFEKDVNE